jgi:hypothetical protein
MSIAIITLASLFLLIGAAAAYHWFTTKSETPKVEPELPPFNPNPDGLQPPIPAPSSEPDYIYLYAGETIDREGKHFKWDAILKKYVEITINETVTTTTVEPQITDAVTTETPKKTRRARKKKGKTAKK